MKQIWMLLVLGIVFVIGTAAALPPPPVANFYADATTVCVHEDVYFTDTSTNEPTAWHWTFGDGTHAYVQNPTYAYNETGVYTVSLKAGNVAGDDDEVKVAYITVIDCTYDGVTTRWCGDRNVFLWNATSDAGAYHIMDHVPERANEAALTATVRAATSPQRVATFITPPTYPDAIGIAPGLWRFRTFHNVTSTVGVTTLEFKVYNRSASGVDTDLFYGHVLTEDINTLAVDEYLYSYARRNYTPLFPGDRLVITVDASTTSTVDRTVFLIVGGNAHASMVSISEFVCEGTCCGTDMASSGGSCKAPGFGAVALISIALACMTLRARQK